jgi:hypothetical protein
VALGGAGANLALGITVGLSGSPPYEAVRLIITCLMGSALFTTLSTSASVR